MSAADAGRARFWRASSSSPADLFVPPDPLRADIASCANSKARHLCSGSSSSSSNSSSSSRFAFGVPVSRSR